MNDRIDFILASASPRRRALCEEAGYRFEVQVSPVDEPPTRDFSDPEAYAVHTAWLKADAVVRTASHRVVAADTVVSLDQAIIGKPIDRADAERILRRLMGTRHRVITGVCLAEPRLGLCLVDRVTSHVTMRQLTDRELSDYLDTGLWAGKAGAYGIQDEDDPFVSNLEGSYSNVVGLPMERLGELIGIARQCGGVGG